MQFKYTVHSAHVTEFPVKAIVGGKEIEAKVPGVVIELVSDDGSMGHTFRYIPEDASDLEGFAVGTPVTVTLEPVKE